MRIQLDELDKAARVIALEPSDIKHALVARIRELEEAWDTWRNKTRCDGCGSVRENEHRADCPVDHAWRNLVMAHFYKGVTL